MLKQRISVGKGEIVLKQQSMATIVDLRGKEHLVRGANVASGCRRMQGDSRDCFGFCLLKAGLFVPGISVWLCCPRSSSQSRPTLCRNADADSI